MFRKLEELKSWKRSGDYVVLCVGIDIGGSGLRIRIANALCHSEFVDLPHIPAHSTPETIAIIDVLVDSLRMNCKFMCSGTVFAVAGPIKGNTCVVTNWPGNHELRTISVDHLPGELCPRGKTVIINDLEAGAYGILAADELSMLSDNFRQLFGARSTTGPMISAHRTAVLAMGSGLGAAIIIKTPLISHPLVLPTEWGHVQIPVVCEGDMQCETERELVQFIADFYYEGKKTPEYEDISSGRGLRLAYKFFKEKEGQEIDYESIDAGEVAEMAKAGEDAAKKALVWDYVMFMRAAKALATAMTCDSVILALDNQVKNAWFVDEIENMLENEFYNYVRPDWMTGIRVYSQTRALNFNIMGTTYMAHQISMK